MDLDSTSASAGDLAVDPEEYLLRRVHRNFGTPDLPIKFTRDAFKPTKDDTDGISLNREAVLAAVGLDAAAMSAAGRKPGEYYVIRLQAKVYIDLGLQLTLSQRDGDLPGHVVVPQLSWAEYNDRSKKMMLKDVQDALIRLASAPDAIVLRPNF